MYYDNHLFCRDSFIPRNASTHCEFPTWLTGATSCTNRGSTSSGCYLCCGSWHLLRQLPWICLDVPDWMPEETPAPTCLVEPLPAIEDAEALSFEANVGSRCVNMKVSHLVQPGPHSFREDRRVGRRRSSVGPPRIVRCLPGAPTEVWDKYMELRDNQRRMCAN